MKVLLVENDRTLIRALVEELRAIPIEVSVAESRDSAFSALEDSDFDLVTCDLKIPSQDGALDEDVQHGFAVSNRVAEISPGVPVIILSAFGTLEMVRLAGMPTA